MLIIPRGIYAWVEGKGVLTTKTSGTPGKLPGIETTTNDTRGRVRLAASGGEAVLAGSALFAPEPAPESLLELIDAESRLLAQAVGEHLPLELALRVETLRAQRVALRSR